MSSQGMLKIQKNHVCCEIIFYPRDVCLIHLSKTIFCTCFGVKLSQKSSSGIMLVPGVMRDVRCRAMLPDSTEHVDVCVQQERRLISERGSILQRGVVLFDPIMH